MAIVLNGTSQYLERTTTLGASFPVTISVWFKTDVTTIAQTIWSESSTTGTSRHSLYVDLDAKLKATTFDTGNIGGQYAAASAASVTAFSWMHAAAYFANNQYRRVYLNGVEALNNHPTNPSIAGRNRTNIGARYAGSTVPGAYFDGALAEFCVWTVQLDQGEIDALARGAHPLSIRRANILTYYPLGGFFGNTGDDFSSGGRNTTVVGSPTYEDHPSIYYPQPIYFAPEGASPQSVTLDVIAATTTVYQPSIVPGLVNITVPVIAATTTVYEPVVAALPINITVPVIAANTAVYQPTINVGAVDIAAPLIAATTTVHQPQLTTTNTVTLDAISSTTTVYQPAVAVGAVNISLPNIAATTSVNGPVITLGTGIVLDAIAPTTTIDGPQITPGAVNIAAPLIASTTSVYQPSIDALPVDISLPVIPSAAVVYNPAIELMLQIISLNVIGSNTVVRQPDVTVQSTDTRDVLPSKTRKRRQSIKEQLEEENVAAQILQARQLEQQKRLEEEQQAAKAERLAEQTQTFVESPSIIPLPDVQQALVAYEARQVRNKRLKTLLLMAAMED